MAEKNTTVVQTIQEKNITDEVLNRIRVFEKDGFMLPTNYSVENAMKSAFLILQETTDKDGNSVLNVCSKPSIANALFKMAISGLNPSKNQCYFIAYGKKLELNISYMGRMAVVKRDETVKGIYANCIYDGDEFEYEIDLNTGLKVLKKHNQSFENIDLAKIKGAYAVIVREGAPNYVEVMNIAQIRNAWNQGSMKGNSGAHKNFTDEMAKKTVISRACKLFINSSDDSGLLSDVVEESDSLENKTSSSISDVEYEVHDEMKEKANTKEIDIEPDPADAAPPFQPPKQTKMEGPGF